MPMSRVATASWPPADQISTARARPGSTLVVCHRCRPISNRSGTTGIDEFLSMSKAFVKESDQDDDDLEPEASPLPAGTKNYITREGYTRLRSELEHLMNVERPDVVQIVSWAASNGDRSEN